jgi:hypothetical protein
MVFNGNYYRIYRSEKKRKKSVTFELKGAKDLIASSP